MTSKREKIIIEEIQKSINNGSFNVKILSKNRIKIEHNGMLGTRDCFVDRNDLNNFDYNSKIWRNKREFLCCGTDLQRLF